MQCYYIGATSDAATKITNEVSKPLSYHMPVEKVCEKLKKKDSQICELKYGKFGFAVRPRFFCAASHKAQVLESRLFRLLFSVQDVVWDAALNSNSIKFLN